MWNRAVRYALCGGLALALWGCAASSKVTAPPVAVQPPPPAPAPLPLASSLAVVEWLPPNVVLAARVEVEALHQAGPLPALLEVWLGEDSALIEHARRVHVGVEAVQGSERVVLVVEAEHAPPNNELSAWTQIASDGWVSCVRACEGYAMARTPVTRSTDVRAPLLPRAPVAVDEYASAPPQELIVVHVGELLDEGAPEKAALRDRLLDTTVSVASELREGWLRVTQTQNTLTTELHASFTSRGVASSASLLTRGAVFEAADGLERVGLTREADLLYGISLSLGEVDDMTAKLSVPLDAVPTLALAWLAARNQGPMPGPSPEAAPDEAESSQQ